MKGKIIGGIVGGIVGHGPWGAVVGAIVGHFCYDKFVHKKEQEKSFCKYLSAALVKMAKVDGNLSESEINECNKILDELGYYDDMREYAVYCLKTAKNTSDSIEDITRIFAKEFNLFVRRHIYFLSLCRIACADGNLVESELKALQNVANILRLNLSDYVSTNGNAKNTSNYSSSVDKMTIDEAYEILGVSATASDGEIKKVYRQKCKELHPDVLGSKKLGDFAMKILEAELKRINDAYETIKKYRR